MNRFLRFAIPWVAVAVTPALVSCGGDSSASPPPPAITVSVAPPSSTVGPWPFAIQATGRKRFDHPLSLVERGICSRPTCLPGLP